MNNIDHQTPLVLDSLISMLFDIDQMVISNIVVVTWTYHMAVVGIVDTVVMVMMIVVVVVMMTAATNQFVDCIVNLIVFPQKDLLRMMRGARLQIVVVLMVRIDDNQDENS